jgi:general secretion pathway protein B
VSYILEALRRAEAERQRGSVPNLHTPVVDAPALLPPAPSGFGLGRAPLLGLGALALVVVGWLAAPQLHRLWQSSGDTQAPASAAAPAPAPAVSQAPAPAPTSAPSSAAEPAPAPGGAARMNASAGPGPKAAPSSANGSAGGQSAGTPAKPPSKQVAGRPEASQQGAPAKPAAAKAPQGSSADRASTSASSAPVAGTRTVPKPAATTPAKPSAATPARRLAELPESVRRRIPPLALGGVVYSSVPASRLVVVNGQVLREGESAGKGVKLERVTPLGAIFSFDGHRFEILQ